MGNGFTLAFALVGVAGAAFGDPAHARQNQPAVKLPQMSPFPESRYELDGMLYTIDPTVHALPKKFGTWAKPKVAEKDIQEFEKTVRADGGRLRGLGGLTSWQDGTSRFMWHLDRGIQPPILKMLKTTTGWRAAQITIPNPPAEPLHLVELMQEGQHLVVSEQGGRRIWILQLQSESPMFDNLTPEHPFPALPRMPLIGDQKALDVDLEHFSLGRLPAHLKVAGEWSSGRPSGFQEWNLRPEELAKFREAITAAGAHLIPTPTIQTVYKSDTRLDAPDPANDLDTKISFYLDSYLACRVRVQIQHPMLGIKTDEVSDHILPYGCSRVLIVPVLKSETEIFILSPKPAK